MDLESLVQQWSAYMRLKLVVLIALLAMLNLELKLCPPFSTASRAVKLLILTY